MKVQISKTNKVTLQECLQKLQNHGHMMAATAIHQYGIEIASATADRVKLSQDCVSGLCKATHSNLIWTVKKPKQNEDLYDDELSPLIEIELICDNSPEILHVSIRYFMLCGENVEDHEFGSDINIVTLVNNEIINVISHEIIWRKA